MAGSIGKLGNITNSNLILHLDAGKRTSYDRSGSTWTDLSPNQNDGTLNSFSSQIIWTNPSTNASGGAITFNGTNNWISVNHKSELVFSTSNFSVNIWFMISSLKGYQAIIVKPGNSDYNGWALYLENNNSINFISGDGTPGVWKAILGDGFVPSVNTWYNYIMTRNGNNWTLYRDGNSVSTSTSSFSISDAGNPINIGRYLLFPGGAKYLSGSISLIQIYNRSLSSAEITQLYTNQKTRFLPKVSDQDAQTFINAAFLYVNIQANAINNLVIDLKNAGLWTKMKAIYPVIGGSAFTHKFNLKDPRDDNSAYRLFFSGTWTHGSTGMTPSSAYANTYFIPVNNSSLNSSHVSFYSRTNSDGGSGAYTSYVDIGGSNQLGSAGGTGLALRTSDIFYGRVDVYPNSASDAATASNTDSRGFYIASRTSSTSTKIYKNGMIVGSSSATGNRSTKSLLISADNKDNPDQIVRYSNRQSAFITIGDGLTDTEASNFYTIVQTYQTALGRQI